MSSRLHQYARRPGRRPRGRPARPRATRSWRAPRRADLKVLATGLGAGILIDAVIVRCLLVPALVALFGRANWWLPAPLARVLRIPAPPTPLADASGQPAARDELVLSSR